MQVLSDRLVEALKRDGGQLLMRHTVEHIHVKDGKATGVVIESEWRGLTEPADHGCECDCAKSVAALGRKGPEGYQHRVKPPQASVPLLCI